MLRLFCRSSCTVNLASSDCSYINDFSLFVQRAKARAVEQNDATAVALLELTANYFTYFRRTWEPVVKDWSLAGRIEAAEKTGIALDRIPTTNNHLEGFNSALKASYLARCVVMLCVFSTRRATASRGRNLSLACACT